MSLPVVITDGAARPAIGWERGLWGNMPDSLSSRLPLY